MSYRFMLAFFFFFPFFSCLRKKKKKWFVCAVDRFCFRARDSLRIWALLLFVCLVVLVWLQWKRMFCFVFFFLVLFFVFFFVFMGRGLLARSCLNVMCVMCWNDRVDVKRNEVFFFLFNFFPRWKSWHLLSFFCSPPRLLLSVAHIVWLSTEWIVIVQTTLARIMVALLVQATLASVLMALEVASRPMQLVLMLIALLLFIRIIMFTRIVNASHKLALKFGLTRALVPLL